MKHTPESHEDRICRIESMAAGESKWDLSENDIAALKTVLLDRASLLAASRELCSVWAFTPVEELPGAIKAVYATIRAAIEEASGVRAK